ncbi:hypothetical protein QQS21_010013 [Conoideocrella luteorostrata]|uniref:Cytochrome P450 n=1 Tax=Conoideocrella luteorostrata TaxID=1105319 RepID=A0AAJ0CI82_9HYPO|nr:hypothetical protein QQS21_010013 [Conoideocrella luteorostrata]
MDGMQSFSQTADQASMFRPTITAADNYAYRVAFLLTLAACFVCAAYGGHKSRLQVPGPQGMPLFGSIFELRKGHAKTLDTWSRRYRDYFRVVLGSKEVVILNTRAAVAKTLVKQGANYQTRPEWDIWHETFVHGADTGGVLTMGTSRWTPNVSKLRKLLGPHTTAQRLPRYNHFASRRFLRLIKLLADAESDPQDLGYVLWSTTIGTVTDQLVGYIHDEEFVRLICDTEINIFRLRTLGTPLHDWVPQVRFSETLINTVTSGIRPVAKLLGLPVPQLSLNATEERSQELRLNQSMYCKQQLDGLTGRIKNGDMTPSQLGDLFRALPERLSEYDEYMLMTTLSGSGMAIGTTLNWLMGYLASHNELQERAHSAIREVYNGEVPDPYDTDRVEYLKALGLEAGRYWTPVRLGFSRETSNDSHIGDHFIPKGTMVIYNSFQINRDPAGYDCPERFVPERWMGGNQGRTDMTGVGGDKIGVSHMGHGAGRRLCLGIPNVTKTVYGVLALTLHFFKLERAELDSKAMAAAFPSFRACRQSTLDMDPIHDQVSTSDAQAVPCATGIRLTPRDPQQLAAWIRTGHQSLQDFEAPWA